MFETLIILIFAASQIGLLALFVGLRRRQTVNVHPDDLRALKAFVHYEHLATRKDIQEVKTSLADDEKDDQRAKRQQRAKPRTR